MKSILYPIGVMLLVSIALVAGSGQVGPDRGSMSRQNANNVAITGGSITGLTALAGAAGADLTIASGSITVNRPIHTVIGEGDAADDLITINGGSEGQMLMLHGVDAGYNITLKEAAIPGNIKTAGVDYVLEDNLIIQLAYHDGEWHVLNTLPTTLSPLAGLTSAANKGIYYTGSGTASTFDLTSYARQLTARATAQLWREDLLAERVATYNPLDDGMTLGDGTDDTAAWDACVARWLAGGGGVITFPAGGEAIIQGGNFYPGLIVWGMGSERASDFGIGTGSSRIRLPDSPVANVPMFRLPKGVVVDDWRGGGFYRVELVGDLSDGAFVKPTAASGNRLYGIDLRTWQKQTVTAAVSDTFTATAHGLSTGDAVQFNNIGGGLPTVGGTALFSDFTYYARNTGTDTFTLHPTSADATNNTNVKNIDGEGTGTHYMGRACARVMSFAIEDCTIRNFDIGARGSYGGDLTFRNARVLYQYNFWGFMGQEHPLFTDCWIDHNYVGITGRFVDAMFNGLYLTDNTHGVVPHGVSSGGQLYQPSNSQLTFLNVCAFNNCKVFGNTETGIAAGAYCSISGSQFSSNGTVNSTSIDLKLQGNGCTVGTSQFGQGTAATTPGRCSILLDRSAGGNTGFGTNISGNVFHQYANAGDDRPAIMGGDSGAASPAYGLGSWGALQNITVSNNSLETTGERLLDVRSNTGAQYGFTINGNNIHRTGTSGATMGATDGFIEGRFYQSTTINGNTESSLQSATHYIVKVTDISEDPRVTIIGNRGETVTEAVNIRAMSGNPTSVVHSNYPSTIENYFRGGLASKNGATSAGYLDLYEDSDNGTNRARLIGPASTADVTLTLPNASGTIVTDTTLSTTYDGVLRATQLRLLDNSQDHELIVETPDELTGNRVLDIVTGDSNRQLTLSGDPTLADWFDQSVKTTASPEFDTPPNADNDDSAATTAFVMNSAQRARYLRPYSYVAGRYYDAGGLQTTFGMAADFWWLMPFIVGENWSPEEICIDVGTTGTATDAKLAIWSAGTGNHPTASALVANSTATVAVGTTGLKAGAITPTLAPGMYWLGCKPNGTVTIGGLYITENAAHQGRTAANLLGIYYYKSDAYANSAPNPFTADGANPGAIPQILLRDAP